jgi:hypothetical protein
MTESKYYRRMLLRGLFSARNQTVSYFDSMTVFGRYAKLCKRIAFIRRDLAHRFDPT